MEREKSVPPLSELTHPKGHMPLKQPPAANLSAAKPAFWQILKTSIEKETKFPMK